MTPTRKPSGAPATTSRASGPLVGFRVRGRPGSARLVGLLALVLLLLGSPLGSPAASAQAEGVDLITTLLRNGIGGAAEAADIPTPVHLSVANLGGQPASNVVVSLVLPEGVRLLSPTDDRCTGTTGTVRCDVGSIDPITYAPSFSFVVDFGSTGSFVLTSSATADQADVDDDSAGEIDFVVAVGAYDLQIRDTTKRVLTGAVHQVSHGLANRGPLETGPVSVTGTFPEGAEFVPGTMRFGTGPADKEGPCTTSPAGYTCGPIASLPMGSRASLRYDVIAPDVPGPITATISATYDDDLVPSNNTATATLEVAVPVAEIGIGVNAPSVTAGGRPFDARVGLSNTGDGVADDVVATLEVPDGWSIAPPVDPDHEPVCEVDPPATRIRCAYGSVPPAKFRFLSIPVTPPAHGMGSGMLRVTASTSSPETGNAANEGSTQVRYLPTGADLVADSSVHEPEAPRSGRPGWITWTFRNESSQRLATDITATVTLPPGTSGMSLRVGQGGGSTGCSLAPDSREATCTRGGVSDAPTVVVQLYVSFDTGGTYPFTATVSQSSEEQSPGDESLTHIVEVETGEADLQLTTAVSGGEVEVGEIYSYVVTVRNDGPHMEDETLLSDELPENVELVRASEGWRNEPCDVRGNAFTCWLGVVGPGRSRFAVVHARATGTGTAASAPTVSGTLPDPDPSSNTVPVTLDVVEPGDGSPADLALTLTPPAGPVVAGEPVTTVVEIENAGNRAATDVTLTLDDPTNLEVVSATHGWFQYRCDTDRETRCIIPTIYAGGSAFVELTARPLAPGPFDATLTLSSDQPDPDPANNTADLAGAATAPS